MSFFITSAAGIRQHHVTCYCEIQPFELRHWGKLMSGRLSGKRVLVTQADDYMGPATIEVFREEGAEVIADNSFDAARTLRGTHRQQW